MYFFSFFFSRKKALFLPIYRQILKDIEISNSSALAGVGRHVNANTAILNEALLAMRGIDTRLQSFQSNIRNFSIQTPSAGLFPQDAPLTLFDAIGRVFPVPIYLACSFDVSSRIGTTFLGLFADFSRCFTISLRSCSKTGEVMRRSCSGSVISPKKTAKGL
jgi:hypothetical protein